MQDSNKFSRFNSARQSEDSVLSPKKMSSTLQSENFYDPQVIIKTSGSHKTNDIFQKQMKRYQALNKANSHTNSMSEQYPKPEIYPSQQHQRRLFMSPKCYTSIYKKIKDQLFSGQKPSNLYVPLKDGSKPKYYSLNLGEQTSQKQEFSFNPNITNMFYKLKQISKTAGQKKTKEETQYLTQQSDISSCLKKSTYKQNFMNNSRKLISQDSTRSNQSKIYSVTYNESLEEEKTREKKILEKGLQVIPRIYGYKQYAKSAKQSKNSSISSII